MNGKVPGLGFLIGCLFCYGSKVGYYHEIGLPIILFEMERGNASIFGTIDESTLVLVSAGICSANLSLSKNVKSADVALWKRGLRMNLLCGDFIEAAYPLMERSVIVNFAVSLPLLLGCLLRPFCSLSLCWQRQHFNFFHMLTCQAWYDLGGTLRLPRRCICCSWEYWCFGFQG